MYRSRWLRTVALAPLLTGCATSLHGTFVTSTYPHGSGVDDAGVSLGAVRGESCQTAALYFFPVGSAPSTSAAVADALAKAEGATYLVDVAIDDHRDWQLGYLVACIVVDAVAYRPATGLPSG
jgi:hypothetical protein